jgi:hypothetical protein
MRDLIASTSRSVMKLPFKSLPNRFTTHFYTLRAGEKPRSVQFPLSFHDGLWEVLKTYGA